MKKKFKLSNFKNKVVYYINLGIDFFKKSLKKIKIEKFRTLSLSQVLILLIVFILLFITIYVFMQFTLLITVDSTKYYKYLEIFNGKSSFAFWDTTRGFGFPIVLFFITKIFGDSIIGILIGFLLFYLGMIYCAAKIIANLIKNNNLEKRQAVYWVFFIIFFLFNPLIIGYSHIMLTEAIVPFFYMLTSLLCLNWNRITLQRNKKKFIKYAIVFIILGSFIWFIKQPYAVAYWSMLGLTSILSGIYHGNFKVFVHKIMVLLLCLIFTFLSIQIWNGFLKINGKQSNTQLSRFDGITNTSIFANDLTLGYRYHYKRVYKEEFCSLKYINSLKLSDKNKQRINNLIKSNSAWCNYLSIFNIHDINGNYLETDVIIQKDKQINLWESLSFYFRSLIGHPILVLNSYYHDYLTILDFEYTVQGISEYIPTGILDSTVYSENHGAGYGTFNEGISNCWWNHSDTNRERYLKMEVNMSHYEDYLKKNSLSTIMKILSKFSDITFMFFLYFSFPIFVYGLVMSIKKKNNLSYFMITILSGSSFFNILFHIMMAAIVDRYCYPIYPLMLLCIIIMMMDKSKKYKLIEQSNEHSA